MDIRRTHQSTQYAAGLSGTSPIPQKSQIALARTGKSPARAQTERALLGGGKHEVAALRALATSLEGDFAELGMVLPPRSYAGMRWIRPEDLREADRPGEELLAERSPRIGALARMRLLMIKSILSRIAGDRHEGDTTAREMDVKA